MPNRNYINGAALEYKVIENLKTEWNCDLCIRSAGSHGLYDVMGINSQEGMLYFAQAKKGSAKVSKEDLELMVEKAKKLKKHFGMEGWRLNFLVFSKKKREPLDWTSIV